MIYIQFWTCKKQLKAVKNTFQFVFGCLLCSKRFFSGYSGFPLSSKTNIIKFQFYQESDENDLVDVLPPNHLLFIFLLHVQSRLKKIERLFKDFQRNFKDFSRKNRIQGLFKTVWTLPIDLLVMTVILEQVQT